jgi:phenylpropionate dioxygenase-like ring-hydroxylating dioxygenase large terminal subunit
VQDDCVVCPFHGWHWDPDGRNRYIPYQEDRPNKSRRLTAWPTYEHAGVAYMWQDVTGGGPTWSVPDIFTDTADHTAALAYHDPGPEAQISYGRRTLHPQLVSENAADPIHFRYVHGTRDHPVFIRVYEAGRLRIKVPAALAAQFGSHLDIGSPVKFGHRGTEWAARVAARRAVR